MRLLSFYFAPNELNAIKVALILFDVQIFRCANILGLNQLEHLNQVWLVMIRLS